MTHLIHPLPARRIPDRGFIMHVLIPDIVRTRSFIWHILPGWFSREHSASTPVVPASLNGISKRERADLNPSLSARSTFLPGVLLGVLMAGGMLICGLAGCNDGTYLTVAGRICDARSGGGIEGAAVRIVGETASTAAPVHATSDGFYVLSGVKEGDSVAVDAAGFRGTRFVVHASAPHIERVRRDLWLLPVIDTAWTSDGPVDASVFLSDAASARKKLSINEARTIVRRFLPEGRIRRGSLINVSDHLEWMFVVTVGHADATVYLNAMSGEVRSVESEDPLLDRRLQQLLEAPASDE